MVRRGAGRNSKQVFAGTTRIATKLEISPTGEGYGPGAKNLKEVSQYFYHQDHLGSTGFATDATGEVWQHLEYFPFGETWVNEVSDDLRVRYRFTGQEFDQETKLYYHGARYYDPKTSVWQSPEPALGTFLNAGKAQDVLPSLANEWRTNLAGAGMGGMFDPRNLNGFGYVHQNPVRFTDPNGRCIEDACVLEGAIGIAFVWGLASTYYAQPKPVKQQQWNYPSTQHSNNNAVSSQAPARDLSGSNATPPNPFDPREQQSQASTTPEDNAGLRDLGRFRSELGLQEGEGTLSRLDAGGKSFYGVNAHGQEITLRVNPISSTHAEADAFQQAANAGVRGGRGTLYVDRALCQACGLRGAVKSMARQLGLEELKIVTPQGVSTIVP